MHYFLQIFAFSYLDVFQRAIDYIYLRLICCDVWF